MMKQIKNYLPIIISILVIAVVLFVGEPVLAEDKKVEGSNTTNSPIQKWPSFYDCGPAKLINESLERRGEIAIVESIGVMQIPPRDGGTENVYIQSTVMQYYNQATGTYSIVAEFENGWSCMLLFGHGLKPAAKTPLINKDMLEEKLEEETQKIDPKDIKTITDNRFELT